MHCTQPRFTVDHLEGNTLGIRAEKKNTLIFFKMLCMYAVELTVHILRECAVHCVTEHINQLFERDFFLCFEPV